MKRIKGEEVKKAESSDRRQFLHNALRFGGAAALLLTSAGLTRSLALSAQELEAARRAKRIPGGEWKSSVLEAKASLPSNAGCQDCTGGCSGCTGGCTGCTGGCTGCTGGCSGCTGGCSGTSS